MRGVVVIVAALVAGGCAETTSPLVPGDYSLVVASVPNGLVIVPTPYVSIEPDGQLIGHVAGSLGGCTGQMTEAEQATLTQALVDSKPLTREDMVASTLIESVYFDFTVDIVAGPWAGRSATFRYADPGVDPAAQRLLLAAFAPVMRLNAGGGCTSCVPDPPATICYRPVESDPFVLCTGPDRHVCDAAGMLVECADRPTYPWAPELPSQTCDPATGWIPAGP